MWSTRSAAVTRPASAQWRLSREKRVANAPPALVVAALVGSGALVGQSLQPALSPVRARTVVHYVGTGSV